MKKYFVLLLISICALNIKSQDLRSVDSVIEAYQTAANGDSHAFQKLLNYANSEWILAQGLVGVCYFYGFGTDISIPNAVSWVKKAAKDGNGDLYAISELAYYYGEGLGIEKNLKESIRLMKIVAKGGIHPLNVDNCISIQAMYNLGYTYLEKLNDMENAVFWLKKAADNNNIKAIYTLGYIFFSQSLDLDDDSTSELAYNYLRKGYNLCINNDESDQVMSKFENQLAFYYLWGRHPVRKDFGTALEYFKKAAQHGHLKAARMVVMIQNGEFK